MKYQKKWIISGSKDKKLNLNLKKLLINCEEHNINGLIFKIKNDKKLSINNPQYESIIFQEMFNIIVPTFCQDIIAYILTSKSDIEYQKFNDAVIDIYKKIDFITSYHFLKKFSLIEILFILLQKSLMIFILKKKN